MKAYELRERLLAGGCNESSFAVKSRGNEVYCLDEIGDTWVVFYTERGQDSDPIFKSSSEDDACQFFYDYVMKLEHWHIVGFFKEEVSAKALEAKLLSIGVKPIRNDIPSYKFNDDTRYRVFVAGKEIFKVREALGEISINYA
jgi:hypothetical protein